MKKASKQKKHRKCLTCGAPTDGTTFCSTRCNKTYLQRKYRIKHVIYCPYRDNIVCTNRTCQTCGWNPEVEKMRKKRLEQDADAKI